MENDVIELRLELLVGGGAGGAKLAPEGRELLFELENEGSLGVVARSVETTESFEFGHDVVELGLLVEIFPHGCRLRRGCGILGGLANGLAERGIVAPLLLGQGNIVEQGERFEVGIVDVDIHAEILRNEGVDGDFSGMTVAVGGKETRTGVFVNDQKIIVVGGIERHPDIGRLKEIVVVATRLKDVESSEGIVAIG